MSNPPTVDLDNPPKLGQVFEFVHQTGMKDHYTFNGKDWYSGEEERKALSLSKLLHLFFSFFSFLYLLFVVVCL